MNALNQPKHPLTQKPKLFATLALLLVAVAPLQAMPEASCHDALTLPMDHSTVGYLPAKESKRYAIEVARSGFVVTEARGAGKALFAIRFLGSDCSNMDSNLPIPVIHGRHLHRVQSPGRYLVEIVADDFGGNYRLDAWWIEESPDSSVPTKEEMADADEFNGDMPTKEEMADADEFSGGVPTKEEMADADEFNGGVPTKEEMADADEFNGGVPTKEEMADADEFSGSSAWQEVTGHGLLEIAPATRGFETHFYSLCPWTRRPDLLATFTCAPRLRLATSGMVTVTQAAGSSSRLIGVTLVASGLLAVESADDPSAKTVVFDAEGRFAGELAGDTAWLEAGDYFLETETVASQIRIYADLD